MFKEIEERLDAEIKKLIREITNMCKMSILLHSLGSIFFFCALIAEILKGNAFFIIWSSSFLVFNMYQVYDNNRELRKWKIRSRKYEQ